MKTVIMAGHVHDVPTRELTDTEAAAITAGLAQRGIHVEPVVDIFHVLHLWARGEVSTREEVTALAAFFAATDCRICWHQAVSYQDTTGGEV